MKHASRLVLRHRAATPCSQLHLRCFCEAPKADVGKTEDPKAEEQQTEGAASSSSASSSHQRLSVQAKRAFVAAPSGGTTLSKLQRGGLGTMGAGLATAGVGGYAWLHWPLMGPGGACVAAGMTGMALLAVAAKGKLPDQSQGKQAKVKQVLEVKLLNDDTRFKSDADALRKLGASHLLPQAVEAALAESDKSARETKKVAEAKQASELLEEVKKELKAGTSSGALRQRLRPRLFVFDFKPSGDGAMAARPGGVKKQLDLLTTSVSFIVANASAHDEALLRLTSPGGAVSTYGLAASQLQRLREAGVRFTVCVDAVAASGGYMMACVADEIVAAPFAMVGSIGVIAGVPNVHKVLERNEVEFNQFTAGKYKRTLNVLTPNTEEGIAKFREDLDVIHVAFQQHIQQFRPALDVEAVATGEVWLGQAALERGLVDGIGTSDAKISAKVADGFDAVQLSAPKKQKQGLAKLLEGLGGADAMESTVERGSELARSIWARLQRRLAAAPAPRAEAPHLHDL